MIISCCANTSFAIDKGGILKAAGENRFGQIDDTLKEYNTFQSLGTYQSICASNTTLCKIDFDNKLTVNGRFKTKEISNVKYAITNDKVLVWIDNKDTLHYKTSDKEEHTSFTASDVVLDDDLIWIDLDNNVNRLYFKLQKVKDLGYKAKKLFYKYKNYAYIDMEGIANINGECTGIKAKKIQFGFDFTVLLSADNEIWYSGSNNYNQIPDFKSTKILKNTKIKAKDIACGSYHIAYINEDNILCLSGYNYNGQLGKKFSESFNETDIIVNLNIAEDFEVPEAPEVIKTRVTKSSKIQETSTNDIYELLKKQSSTKIDYTKTLEEILDKIKNISTKEPKKTEEREVKISVGRDFSALIDKEHNLYLKGKNTYGQLDKDLDDFTKQDIKAKDVSCGFGHILLIDLDDNLWVRGMNYYGQLGLNNNEHQTKFINTGIKVSYIKAGNWTSYIIKQDGLVYEAGQGIEGSSFKLQRIQKK